MAATWLGRLPLEQLESRYAMNGDPVPWDNASALTLSFAPDGTLVGDQPSALEATFGPIQSTDAWHEAMARAFETWAQYANINVGVVADGGQPLGVRGASHADDRFGDIRVAGTPMSAETLAAAIDQTRLSAGTWTGDMLFNTDGSWTSPNDIFSAALHEAGHVLGLKHSTDPTSPMFTHGVSANLVPTAADITAIQQLYGARTADENELNQDNDSIGRATKIRNSEPIDGFDGTLPLVQFGDLHTVTDADYFLLPVLPGYSGALSFEVRTGGLSLLEPRITVFDKQGHELGRATFTGKMGGTATLTLNSPFTDKLYARVDAATSDLYGVGGYSLVVRYDGLVTTPEADIARAVHQGFRWRGQTDHTMATVDVRPYLMGDDSPQLDDDAGTDDGSGSGRRLKAVVDTASLRKYQYVGAIGTSGDLDQYALRSPSFSGSTTRGMTVTIESLERGGVIGQVDVLDPNGAVAPVQVLANGSGLVILRLPQVVSNKDYTVRVKTAAASDATHLGNYTMAAEFDVAGPTQNTWLNGQLTSTAPEAEFTLYVARTQLFSLGLDSTVSAGAPGSVVWITIYDDQLRPVFFAGNDAGTMRTAPSVLLAPGQYVIQIASRQADGVTPADLSFSLSGEQLTDPVGPPVVDPGTPPIYSCPSGPTPYCYPGGITDVTPFVFVAGSTVTPPNVSSYQIVNPGDAWFWLNEFLGTNPNSPLDVNADGFITPLDALVVINYMNESGTGPLPPPPVKLPYIDVSGDQMVAPQDALIVINQLNQNPGPEGEAEGEATNLSAVDAAFADAVAWNWLNLIVANDEMMAPSSALFLKQARNRWR